MEISKHSCGVCRPAYWPASRVSTTKLELLKVVPWTRPSPWALTWLASPISDWTTMMVMGLLATWRPFFRMLTRCSPTSRGMKEIPRRRRRRRREGVRVQWGKMQKLISDEKWRRGGTTEEEKQMWENEEEEDKEGSRRERKNRWKRGKIVEREGGCKEWEERFKWAHVTVTF